MPDVVEEGDRITYAQAIIITGRSRRYLQKLASAGVLAREGGTRTDPYRTWLSRSECEALALAEYRRGRVSDYWMSLTEVAELLGVSRQAAQQARADGRLPAQRTAIGDWLVRRDDIHALVITGKLAGLSPGQGGRTREAGNQAM